MSEKMPEGRPVPIEWYIPEGFVSRYATNMVVQHTGREFIISFFKLIPPIMLGPEEEVEAQFQQLESIRAECVAQIIVDADRMANFIEALQTNLDRYRARQEKAEKDD